MANGQLVFSGESLALGAEGSTALYVKRILKTTSTFDQANNATANTGTEATVTVTGAALGDLAFAIPQVGSPDPAGTDIIWQAYVSAADTVKIRFQIGATARDMASQTWTVIVVDIT